MDAFKTTMNNPMKKMYIVVSNDIYQDQRMQRIANAFIDLGLHVTILGRKKSNSNPLPSFSFQTKRFSLLFDKGPLFYLHLNIRIFWFLFWHHYDYIVSVDEDTLLACTIANNLKGKKLIFDAHELFISTPEVTNRKWIQAIWKSIGLYGTKHAHHRLTVSQSLSNVLAKQYKYPFTVIRNMPLLSPSHVTRKLKKPYIIYYQGMVNAGRGLIQMINALQSSLLKDFELWIAGDGDCKDQLVSLATSQLLSSRVKFLGMLDKANMDRIINDVTIGINFLDSTSKSYQLSLANKFFDYVHAELPSIHMDFDEYSHHVAQFKVGIVIPDLTEASIVNALTSITTDEDTYNQYIDECNKAKKVWSWQNEKTALSSLIR